MESFMGLLDRIFGTRKAPIVEPKHHEDDMVSLVVLSQTWLNLPLDHVRATLDSLYPGVFLPPREEGSFVIEGPAKGASFLIQCAVPEVNAIFNLHDVPGPYSDFSDFGEHISDSELRELALQQQCWMSEDRMHAYERNDEGAYRFISRVVAQLAPPDAAVLLHPSLMLAIPFTDDVRRLLASGGHPFGTA
jgi:hypothetical protein